ncbi:hypothetical protein QQZ08_009243 [Neonectria magnoliae]|uniref:Uncharacterized protein n=1 Tax=Neonectria magnoliae TaxID=2732573 RepID=A0ABR1HR95_9HYPO
MFASGASRSLEADGSKSECRESSQQDVFFEAGTGTLSPDNAMASINYLDTLQLDQNDWIGIGYDSPPNALQSPAVSPTMANDAFNDSAVISTSPPSQSVLPNARLTRSQTLRLASSRGENNRDAEADNVLEPFSGSPSSLSSLRYQPSTRCSFASSSSTLKDKTSLSASRKTLTQGTAAELTACDSRAGGGGGGEWSHKNPLLTAVMLGNLEVARLLLGSSAKLDDPDHSGNTNLHHAVQRGEVSMASALLELGADVTTTNSDSKGLLHTAVQNNDLEMVRMLLEWCDAHSQRKEQPSASASKREEKQGNEGGNSTLIQRCINARDEVIDQMM